MSTFLYTAVTFFHFRSGCRSPLPGKQEEAMRRKLLRLLGKDYMRAAAKDDLAFPGVLWMLIGAWWVLLCPPLCPREKAEGTSWGRPRYLLSKRVDTILPPPHGEAMLLLGSTEASIEHYPREVSSFWWKWGFGDSSQSQWWPPGLNEGKPKQVP
ncbi:hypothetical protein SK128_006683 [Halocaridina rubra]|uniref:Uncharacterized protein n=1 Tax=Halocaridina rubra TaxID=373956 RepID=A0AAN8XG46_HALRR